MQQSSCSPSISLHRRANRINKGHILLTLFKPMTRHTTSFPPALLSLDFLVLRPHPAKSIERLWERKCPHLKKASWDSSCCLATSHPEIAGSNNLGQPLFPQAPTVKVNKKLVTYLSRIWAMPRGRAFFPSNQKPLQPKTRRTNKS